MHRHLFQKQKNCSGEEKILASQHNKLPEMVNQLVEF